MTKINLRDHYPYYLSDLYIEVSDDIAKQLKQFGKKDHADYERRRIYKAYFSLDVGIGIESNAVLLVLSPEEIYEQKLNKMELYVAINSLPEKQAKRIYAHFYLGMSKAEIARTEGVSRSQVTRSIDRALKNIEKFLRIFD